MKLHKFEGREYNIDELHKKRWDDLTEDEQEAIEDYGYMCEADYYEKSCESCDLFGKGYIGDRFEPPEPPYCIHPIIEHITNNNPNFPFKNGCKHKIRGVIREPSYWLKIAKPGVKCSLNTCNEDAVYYEVRPNQGTNVCEKHRTAPLNTLDITDVDQLPNLKLFCIRCGLYDTGWKRLTKYQFKCPNPKCDKIIRQVVE